MVLSPGDVVRSFYVSMQARDWDRAARYLAPSVSIRFPATGEMFEGASFLAMNRDYPEGWHLEVVEVIAAGGRVAARVRVVQGGHTFWCAGFYIVDDGRITEAVEHWLEEGGDPAPEWRTPYRSAPRQQE